MVGLRTLERSYGKIKFKTFPWSSVFLWKICNVSKHYCISTSRYDYTSVLHMGQRFLTSRILFTTIKAKDYDGSKLGQREGLSQIDIDKIKKAYVSYLFCFMVLQNVALKNLVLARKPVPLVLSCLFIQTYFKVHREWMDWVSWLAKRSKEKGIEIYNRQL